MPRIRAFTGRAAVGALILMAASMLDSAPLPTGQASPAPRAFTLAEAAGCPPEPGAPRKHRGRAWIELSMLLSYSTIRYWIEYHDWDEDWQYRPTFADQLRRFFTLEALRFDSNAFYVNWPHAIAGALYYMIGRSNRLTPGESFLLSLSGCLFYEYVGEFREVIGINDVVMTAVGGYAVGEPHHQLAQYFHNRTSPFLKALGLINPFLSLQGWLDREDPAPASAVNRGWQDIAFTAGVRSQVLSGEGRRMSAVVGLESEFVLFPGYGRPGVFRRTLRGTFSTGLSLALALRRRGPEEGGLRGGPDEEEELATRVVGRSHYWQNIDALSQGTALWLGIGSGFSYLRQRPVTYDARSVRVGLNPPPIPPTRFRDKFAVVHMAGPILGWARFGPDFRLRLGGDAYLDFAMMNAFAMNSYSAVHPIDGLKTTLAYYGYHYAFGVSASARADLQWRGLTFRALLSAHRWESIEGLDRFQADIVNDASVVDTRARLLLRAGWDLPRLPFQLTVAFEVIHRWGRIAEIGARGRETRLYVGLSYRP